MVLKYHWYLVTLLVIHYSLPAGAPSTGRYDITIEPLPVCRGGSLCKNSIKIEFPSRDMAGTILVTTEPSGYVLKIGSAAIDL